ncbi:MAG: TetR/AcrR family transcriptional regulator [Saprospiraceae bacterium]|nr:TetR/AcrR family transcriptional regulator [Saprospiraceae bacterium]
MTDLNNNINSNELDKILDAAESLFRKYGFRSVTMSEIARDLGMSKKTLYVHIQNKQDLIHKIITRYIMEEKSSLAKLTSKAESALDEMIMINLHVQESIRDINPSLVFDLKKYHRPVWEKIEEFHQEYALGAIRENLKRGIKEGIYRKEININILSRIYIGCMPVFSDEILFPVRLYPPAEVHKEFMNYHLNGILSKKGQELLTKYTHQTS